MAADPHVLDSTRTWTLPARHSVVFKRPSDVMGILNVTPDSFSDGGSYADPAAACAQGLRMAAAGATWIDIGGESTRPGAAGISEQLERERVIPAVAALAEALGHAHPQVMISCDTSKPGVARRALQAGARMINDVTAGLHPEMFEVVAAAGCPLVLMHMQGTPATMQRSPHYQDLLGEIESFFEERLKAAEACGVQRSMIVLDPGIGFGKTLAQNLLLLRALPRLSRSFGRPLLVGISRKSFIARLAGLPDGSPPSARDPASHLLHAALSRDCALLRVHDVPGAVLACRMAAALSGDWTPHV